MINDVITPALMISACGLLCLAQFARYTALIGRARGFNHERHGHLRRLEQLGQDSTERRLLEGRIEALAFQTDRVIVHARLIRDALVLLVGCIMLMVVASLLIAASFVVPGCEAAAFVAFVLGMLCVLLGMAFVLWEMVISLSLVRYETRHVETFGAVDQGRQGSAM